MKSQQTTSEEGTATDAAPASVDQTQVARRGRRGSGDLASHAYQRIREAIISLSFQPGQHLQESFLAQWLGTSRTPVREALHRLHGEGLIESFSSRGAVVAQVSVDDIENAYLAIEVIEGLASRLAAERLTEDGATALRSCLIRLHQATAESNVESWALVDAELHNTIRRIAANPKLDQTAHIVYPMIERVRHMYLLEGVEPDRLTSAMSAHEAIIEAILAEEAARAELLTRELFATAREDNVRLLRQWVIPLRRSF